MAGGGAAIDTVAGRAVAVGAIVEHPTSCEPAVVGGSVIQPDRIDPLAGLLGHADGDDGARPRRHRRRDRDVGEDRTHRANLGVVRQEPVAVGHEVSQRGEVGLVGRHGVALLGIGRDGGEAQVGELQDDRGQAVGMERFFERRPQMGEVPLLEFRVGDELTDHRTVGAGGSLKGGHVHVADDKRLIAVVLHREDPAALVLVIEGVVGALVPIAVVVGEEVLDREEPTPRVRCQHAIDRVVEARIGGPVQVEREDGVGQAEPGAVGVGGVPQLVAGPVARQVRSQVRQGRSGAGECSATPTRRNAWTAAASPTDGCVRGPPAVTIGAGKPILHEVAVPVLRQRVNSPVSVVDEQVGQRGLGARRISRHHREVHRFPEDRLVAESVVQVEGLVPKEFRRVIGVVDRDVQGLLERRRAEGGVALVACADPGDRRAVVDRQGARDVLAGGPRRGQQRGPIGLGEVQAEGAQQRRIVESLRAYSPQEGCGCFLGG